MQYVRSITGVLSDHLGWHRARLKFMARFTAALLQLQTANLWKIAVSLKAGVQDESNHRRIQRFLSGYDLDFTALGSLLVKLLPQTPPYLAVVDRTEWHFGETPVNVLVVGIAHRGIAFPVAWAVLPKGGSSRASDQIEVLERFLAVVDASSIEALVADREFISIDWVQCLQEKGIPFAIRLRSDRHIGISPEGPSLPARMFARRCSVGQEKKLEGWNYLFGADEKHAEADLLVRRIATAENTPDEEDSFLILAIWKIDPERATSLYKQRWEIETMFAALKSRGYRLEQTHLTEPDRIQRLIGLLSVAFAWTHIVGERRAEREGLPPKKTHGRRQRSLFRYGLDLLQGILTTPERQPQAFFACLTGLRSPTAFLSRT